MKIKNNIMVIGSSRLGVMLAGKLSINENKVTIVDISENNLNNVGQDFAGFTFLGDASSVDNLIDAGIEKCDVVISATNDDNVNVFVGLVAKVLFNVKSVIIRLYDETKKAAYEGYGIKAICPSLLSIDALRESLSILGVS